MQFTHPIFLWALAGLSVPIAIHLLSRKEGKVIKMGSLRHLQETSTQQFKGIKLNEFLLLALRSLLIILFVFLISGLHWPDKNKKWVLIEKGVEENPLAKKLLDSLKSQDFEWHWLQEGFPKESELRKDETINYWNAIAQLQQQELSQVIVLSHSYVEQAKGLRTAMGKNIQWITFPSKETNFVAEAIKHQGKILSRKGNSQSDQTNFETIESNVPLSDSIPTNQAPSIAITIASEKKYEQEKLIIKASLTAISNVLPIDLIIEEVSTDKITFSTDWVIWFSDKELKTNDSIYYIFYQAQLNGKSIERVTKNKWSINSRLNVESARESNLPLKLASLLVDEKEKWSKISNQDRRSIVDRVLLSGTTSASLQASDNETSVMNPWLLILFLLILVIERLVSYQRNQ
ncbi:MAG: BatA domain-containing protein [Cyclobacteriaceae bacterium]